MYESFFGLRKRPFAALPDADCFIPIDNSYQALSSLSQCAVDGRGIGVLTAPAGLGKTLVCQRLARELSGRLTVVYLPTGNFLTRRALLQALLFELGHSYVRMGDQELRLALTSVLRRLRPGRDAIAVIVDEAHLLAPRMLEELRVLTGFAESGEPLVRLIVSGQLPLEETLSEPAVEAFNQRIGIQVTLQPLTREESAEYVSRRLAWAGANVSDLFRADAVATICEASDGSPRCLNQLCDHSLLLGYLASQKPVPEQTVREALDDLKQLPLTWNEPLTRRNPLVESRREDLAPAAGVPARDASWIVTAEDDRPETSSIEGVGSIEFGDSVNAVLPATAPAAPTVAAVTGPVAEAPDASSFSVTVSAAIDRPSATSAITVDEEIVVDRYAALDAAVHRLTRTMLCARAIRLRTEAVTATSSIHLAHSAGAATAKSGPETDTIEAAEIDSASTGAGSWSDSAHADDSDRPPRFDVVLPEDASDSSSVSLQPSPVAAGKEPRSQSGRRYELLFSELRRRRRRA